MVDSATSINATFIVTDSRGIKTEKEKLVNMYNWFPPEATFKIERPSSASTGTVTVCPFYASVGGNNSVSLTCYKKKLDDTEYTLVGSLTSNVPLTFEADADYDWDIKICTTDRFGSTNTCYGILPRYKPLAYFDAEKYSLGINCIPTNNNTLEIKSEDVYAALFYSSSETFTISNKLFCPGTLLYNEVFFSISIPKSAKNVTPTLTVLKINA